MYSKRRRVVGLAYFSPKNKEFIILTKVNERRGEARGKESYRRIWHAAGSRDWPAGRAGSDLAAEPAEDAAGVALVGEVDAGDPGLDDGPGGLAQGGDKLELLEAPGTVGGGRPVGLEQQRLLLGAELVLYEGAPDYPAPDRLWEVAARHGVTHLGLSPTVIRALMAHGTGPLAKHDLSSLRVLGSTGEPWNPESWWWFFANVGKGRLPLINYSGGTEVSEGRRPTGRHAGISGHVG